MFDPLLGFDAAKHLCGDQIRITLGVRCDFSRVPLRHSITMEATEERKAKLAALMQSYITTESITEAEAGRLYGKARFVICPRFGRVYLAALQPLHKIHGRAPVKLIINYFGCVQRTLANGRKSGEPSSCALSSSS